jgi:hypothetical protein
MGENETCEWKDDHPVIAMQIQRLEERVKSLEDKEEGRGRMRANDVKEMRDKVDRVSEKVTALAIQLAGINGKLLAAAFFMSGAGALGMFVLTKLFEGGK